MKTKTQRTITAFGFRWLLGAVLCLCGLPNFDSELLGQDADRELTASRKASVVVSSIINGRAWRSGDFLIRIHSDFDTINRKNKFDLEGISVESEVLCRVAFDYDSKMFCVLTWKRETTLNLRQVDDGDPRRKETTSMHGVSFGANQRLLSRTFPKKVVVKKLDTKTSGKKQGEPSEKEFRLLADRHVPDFRAVGLARSWDPGSFKNAILIANRLKTGVDLFKDVELGGNQFELHFKSDARGVVDYRIDKFVFDNTTNLPVSYLMTLHIADPPGELDSVVPGANQTIDWIELNGVYVPSKIRQSGSRSLRIGMENRQFHGKEFNDVDFHWFSLNEKIEKTSPDLFNGNCMKSLESFLSFVDPQKAHADKLIPDEAEQKETDRKAEKK